MTFLSWMYLRNADLRIFLKKNSKKVLTLNIAGDIFIFVADADKKHCKRSNGAVLKLIVH